MAPVVWIRLLADRQMLLMLEGQLSTANMMLVLWVVLVGSFVYAVLRVMRVLVPDPAWPQIASLQLVLTTRLVTGVFTTLALTNVIPGPVVAATRPFLTYVVAMGVRFAVVDLVRGRPWPSARVDVVCDVACE